MRATWMGVKWCAASLERALLPETWGQTGRSPGFRRCKGRKRGTTNLRIAEAATVAGAPFFAHVAKGGYRTATEWFWLEGLKQAGLALVLSAASYSPLHKTQGRAPGNVHSFRISGFRLAGILMSCKSGASSFHSLAFAFRRLRREAGSSLFASLTCRNDNL
jgi:hypothetical protein